MANPKITFIGAGSAVFMKNIVGDILQRPALAGATIRLMDINPTRLEESEIIARKLIATLGVPATVETFSNQRQALDGTNFVVVCFQIGGYEPSTVIDFDVPKKYNLRQTIADTLGVGGIMRGLRTVPHLWSICEDMLQVAPDAIMLQYVNPMAINTWAISEKYPSIKQVGLCHSVQGTAMELAHDLDIPYEDIRYRSAGINHMAFYLKFEHRQPDGSYKDLYPALHRAYAEGRAPKPTWNPRCPNKVRYEMMTRLGYFVTESSEHFAEYTPYFIKEGREDIIEKFGIPLDEYPKRCVEQIAKWKQTSEDYRKADRIEVKQSKEYASSIVNSVWTGEPSVIYGNLRNNGVITNLPSNAAVEVACLRRPGPHARRAAGLRQVDRALAAEVVLAAVAREVPLVRSPAELGRLASLAHEAVDRPGVHELARHLRAVRHLRVALRDVDDLDPERLRERCPLLALLRVARFVAGVLGDVQQRLLHEVRHEPRVRAVRDDRGRPVAPGLAQLEHLLAQRIVRAPARGDVRVGVTARPRLDAGVEVQRAFLVAELDQRDARDVDRQVQHEIATADQRLEDVTVVVDDRKADVIGSD